VAAIQKCYEGMLLKKEKAQHSSTAQAERAKLQAEVMFCLARNRRQDRHSTQAYKEQEAKRKAGMQACRRRRAAKLQKAWWQQRRGGGRQAGRSGRRGARAPSRRSQVTAQERYAMHPSESSRRNRKSAAEKNRRLPAPTRQYRSALRKSGVARAARKDAYARKPGATPQRDATRYSSGEDGETCEACRTLPPRRHADA